MIRLVLVDDHAVFSDSLQHALATVADIEVVGVADCGGDAVGVAAAEQPDVVLMDVQLPDMNGVDAARAVRDAAPESRVVILTGVVDEGILLRAIEAGCAGYITKDRAFTDVVAALRAASAGEAVISPALLARLLPKLRSEEPVAVPGPELTGREQEVLELVATGVSNREIAAELAVSLNTVRNYVQNVLTKLDAHSKLEAVAVATRRGILRVPASPTLP